MNSKLQHLAFELADKAGFVFWEPGESGETIDWSSCYDEELVTLVRLVARECWTITHDEKILEHFGLMRKATL